MRFADFLKATVILSAGAATALVAVTVLAAGTDAERALVLVVAAWWVLAGAIGVALGRRAETSPPIARLLAGARSTTSLPEQNAVAVLLNRLWGVILITVLAIPVGFLAPQVSGIAAGFGIIWALAWRRQEAAVRAIEDRDGVAFYVERTSPLEPMKLSRAPGFRRNLPPAVDRAAGPAS